MTEEETEIEPRVVPRAEHPVSRKDISENTLKVLYRLNKQGFKGYLVGGGVRDLMLGRQPKDFDVSTDARPHEIRRVFRNARIIGRRFRLAHIIFRGEIVEVATFRRTPDPEEQDTAPDDLLITSDNAFGTPREDAFRRDFTINALFYNIDDFSVIDYVGGIDDLRDGLIRVIGDPDVRFAEDPVRMMRACEFAGRLGFTIEAATQEGIQSHRADLVKAATPRLTDELLQLLRSGHSARSVQWMLELGLLEVLLPEAQAMLTACERGAGDFGGIFSTLDSMIQSGREVSDSVLLAAVLLPEILLRRFDFETTNGRFMDGEAFSTAVGETVEPFLDRFAIPNLKRVQMIEALEGFHRLCEGQWKPQQRVRFASKSYFDHALQLFEILVKATSQGADELELWVEARRRRKKRPPVQQAPRRARRRRRR